MEENKDIMTLDEILDNMVVDDVIEDEEIIENPVIETDFDDEFEERDNRDELNQSYHEYSDSFDELTQLLKSIIEKGEYTEEDKEQVLVINQDYDEKHERIVREIENAQTIIKENQEIDFNSGVLGNNQDDVFNALTKNGEIQTMFKDEDGKIYINAEFLQTRGLNVVNDENQVTLKIDDNGNLTTSGDIVGGTITGSVMKAMTINTNEVNITSDDGGMSINGALQKFSDENGNVRILIGKDTDGSFKFILYGENGSTVLIDKNGIKAEAISAGTIKSDHLAPNSIDTKHIKTEVIEAMDARVENLTANKANISDLNAVNATIKNLEAENAKINQAVIGKADIGQLNSANANIGNLQASVAKIDKLLAGNITADNIQAGSITAGSGVIADGAIGSAQISEINAGKINGGTVDTSKVTVAGANNHLKIQGNRLQVFQGIGSQAKERVSVGDVNGDGTVYGLRVRGADGKTVLMDENGVKSEGITDGSITNDKISDNADIDGAKLNINSVINKINKDGTETINGTKIEVNGQTLNAQLSTITNRQNEDGKKIFQAQSQISANTQSIGLKVDNQTYQTDKKNMTSQLEKNTSAIDVLQGQISLKVEHTDIENAITNTKNEIDQDIKNLNKRIDDVLSDVGGAIIEGALDEAKCDIISNTLAQLNKEKEQLLARFDSLYTNDLDSITKANLLNSKNNFVTAHTNLTNTINRIIADKNITQNEKTEYDSKVSAYSTALSTFTKYLDESIKSMTNTKINTAKAEIKVTTDAIAQTVSSLSKTVENKADNSQVSTVSNRVASLETNLNGITQRVESTESTTKTLTTKVNDAQNSANSAQSTANSALDTANANKDNITSLTTRVSTAESKLTKDSLTTTIGKHYTTSSDVDGIVSSKGYQSQSQVQQTVNSLQAKFTSSGGYNLLLNTGFGNGTKNWNTYGATASIVDEATSPTGKAMKVVNSAGHQRGVYQFFKPSSTGYYTLSFYAKASSNMTLLCGQENSTTTNVSLTTSWQKFTYTFNRASLNRDAYIFYANQTGTFYIHSVMVEKGELSELWTPNPNEIYDGVTTIDRDGVTVTASNVKSKTNMSADGFKITKTDTGEEVFKVNSDGTLSIKGNITVTGGSVPTNSLSGTISSNQLNSSITSDINTAKNNASSALSTANTAKNTADGVKSTADSAKATADSAQATANAVDSTLNSNKVNWDNAYNRVKEWANGAVSGTTSINGGMIATNTITAEKIAIGDFNNYSQLQKGRDLKNSYGIAAWTNASAEWTSSSGYFPLTMDNTDNAFNIGDKINVKCSIWIGQSKSIPIGVWFYDANKTNVATCSSTKSLVAGWNNLNFELELNHSNISKSVYMQILMKIEGTYIAVKDVTITRKVSGEMLVDGAITADKIHADAINGKTIRGADIIGSTFSSTSGNFKVLNDGTVDATSLSVNDEISTETLTVQEINNSKYQAVLDRDITININSGGTNSASFTSGATYKSISAFLDACPRCLNGYTVTLNLLSNISENVEINQLHSGNLTINMNGKIIYGYVFLEGESTRFRVYGNKSGSVGGSTLGSIMPNIGMTQAGGCYSMVIHSTQGFFYDLKVYGGKSTDSNIGIRVANWANAYLSSIQFIGCYNGLRTYNLGRAYISSSSGTTTSYAFSAYHGGQVILNPTTQAGKAGATSHVFISNNSTVTSTGVTWSGSAISGSNTNTSTSKTEKTVTITSTLGDTYRSTVYNNWKNDSTVRQGNYGYGNCEGCWFYGDQFVPYQSKEITKIEITIKRQAGGVAGAVTHTLKMHNHATRPSGRPTFSTALSKNFSLATNNSTTVALTTTAEINAFKANKGFGLVPTAQNSSYYSVCSGSATVKITYKE